ncbi:hypothetical protein D3Z36_11870 [Lachnospiraceae bacterium]|nr:hypothetical protein [Lachnospiraceae bacterium]
MNEKYCPLSGKNCTSACAWYTDDDCNFGNLYHIANKVSDMADQLEEIRNSIDDLNETVGSINSSI